ncbi:caspase family protein [Yinghuangia seranimata]|uniref:caspase family protein n=1 Tax=Yinghuangia seranimata TaxID=408067 RepID=UPI00248C3842|nr:caspase family protein [Yinghuangia seranimata]MDI2126034.1 caspase family protein [Yinghuangia seranimata]
MRKRALIVAAQFYDNPNRPELPGAGADARELSSVLGDPSVGGFTVETVVDEASHTIRLAVERFFRTAEAGDLLLLHMSCHGQRNRRGELYFEVRDTDPATPSSTGIDSAFIARLMEESAAKRIVLLLDCCYSGAFEFGGRSAAPQVDVKRLLGGRGRVVLTAATSLQVAYETEARSRDAAEPSVFTSAVVRGLRTGDADLDGDGLISVQELFTYVEQAVREKRPNQTPTMSIDDAQGTIYLADSPRKASTVPSAPPVPSAPLRDEAQRVLFDLVDPTADGASARDRAARLPVAEVVALAGRLAALGMGGIAAQVLGVVGRTRPIADVEQVVIQTRAREHEAWWYRWLVDLSARTPTSDVLALALRECFEDLRAFSTTLPAVDLIAMTDALRKHASDDLAAVILRDAGTSDHAEELMSALGAAGRVQDVGHVLHGALAQADPESSAARQLLTRRVAELPLSDVVALALPLSPAYVIALAAELPPADRIVLVDALRGNGLDIEAAAILRDSRGRPDLAGFVTALGDRGRLDDVACLVSRAGRLSRPTKHIIATALTATPLHRRSWKPLLRARRAIPPGWIDFALFMAPLVQLMVYGLALQHSPAAARVALTAAAVAVLVAWGVVALRWYRLSKSLNAFMVVGGVLVVLDPPLLLWQRDALEISLPTRFAYDAVLAAVVGTLYWLTHDTKRIRAWCLATVGKHRLQEPAALYRLGVLSERDGDTEGALSWYRRAAATGDAPGVVYPAEADNPVADTVAADALTALVRLRSHDSEHAPAWCERVIESAYSTNLRPNVLAAIVLARIEAPSDPRHAIEWYDYALSTERDNAGDFERVLYWGRVELTDSRPAAPRTLPGPVRSLARRAWALAKTRPLATTALLESALLQHQRGEHDDARARLAVAGYFDDPGLRSRVADAHRTPAPRLPSDGTGSPAGNAEAPSASGFRTETRPRR